MTRPAAVTIAASQPVRRQPRTLALTSAGGQIAAPDAPVAAGTGAAEQAP
ncbi:MAG: hypothetical protein ACRDPY_21405 [Streptosporangiaceae bacterium]